LTVLIQLLVTSDLLCWQAKVSPWRAHPTTTPT